MSLTHWYQTYSCGVPVLDGFREYIIQESQRVMELLNQKDGYIESETMRDFVELVRAGFFEEERVMDVFSRHDPKHIREHNNMRMLLNRLISTSSFTTMQVEVPLFRELTGCIFKHFTTTDVGSLDGTLD